MYYFLNGMVNIKNLIYHIGYAKVKDLSYLTINSVNPLYLINKINGYTEESIENQHLTQIPY